MTDLRSRVLARLDQIEAVAEATDGEVWERTRAFDGDPREGKTRPTHVVRDDGGDIAALTVRGEAAEHIATWDPATVLILCTGARQILDVHAPDHDHECVGCGWVQGSDYAREHDVDDCPTLAAVARMLGINPNGD